MFKLDHILVFQEFGSNRKQNTPKASARGHQELLDFPLILMRLNETGSRCFQILFFLPISEPQIIPTENSIFNASRVVYQYFSMQILISRKSSLCKYFSSLCEPLRNV